MLDRTTPPAYQTPKKFKLKKAEKLRLDTDLDMFVINSGKQDVLRLELVFDCGAWDETYPQAALFCVKLLREGTREKSSSEIAEIFDRHGAFLNINPGLDRTILSLYFLPKHLDTLLPVLLELILYPSFPEEELSVMKLRNLQNLKVNLEKNSYVATATFKEQLFGTNHPYGRKLEENYIRSMDRILVDKFYNEVFIKSKVDIHLSGRVNDSILRNISEHLDGLPANNENSHKNIQITEAEREDIIVEKDQSLQTSLRIGNTTIQKGHPDYIRLLITNELLGGFFGSRLMNNIREEKGYTYGISSHVKPLARNALFVIGADVKKQYRDKAVREINNEINFLRTSPPGNSELETLQNYMIGSFQSEINSPFALSDKFKAIYYHGLDYDYYEQYHDTISKLSKDDVVEMAEKYMNPENMLIVSVG